MRSEFLQFLGLAASIYFLVPPARLIRAGTESRPDRGRDISEFFDNKFRHHNLPLPRGNKSAASICNIKIQAPYYS